MVFSAGKVRLGLALKKTRMSNVECRMLNIELGRRCDAMRCDARPYYIEGGRSRLDVGQKYAGKVCVPFVTFGIPSESVRYSGET